MYSLISVFDINVEVVHACLEVQCHASLSFSGASSLLKVVCFALSSMSDSPLLICNRAVPSPESYPLLHFTEAIAVVSL